MYLRTVLATSASIPFFAAFIAEREGRVSEDLIAVAYFCAVGLLLSFAAVLDDSHGLTTWFGLVAPLFFLSRNTASPPSVESPASPRPRRQMFRGRKMVVGAAGLG